MHFNGVSVAPVNKTNESLQCWKNPLELQIIARRQRNCLFLLIHLLFIHLTYSRGGGGSKQAPVAQPVITPEHHNRPSSHSLLT
jgi:hypothetical protein